MDKIQGKVKTLNEESVTVVASSDARDRDGEVLNPEGWKLDNFMKNPVLLWSHRADQLPIGKVTKLWTEGKELLADIVFATHDFAVEVEKMVRSKILNATSVGFIPGEFDEGTKTIKDQELLELSIVNVPSNPTALARSYKDFQAKAKEYEDQKPEPENEPAEPEEKAVKEGRIISEKNRNIMRIAKESMTQSIGAIDDLLEASEPKSRLETTPEPKKGVELQPKTQGKKVNKTLRLAKLMDKVAEAMIHEAKRGGEKQ